MADEFHIVVCVKVVPKPEEIRVDPATHRLVRSKARSEINPPDMNALELALATRDRVGGRVSILSMGPPLFDPFLRAGLAMGADGLFLLSDPAFGGADTLATTYTLAQGIRQIGGVDLVFCGEESSDGATGQVPPGIAEWLDVGQITMITDLEVNLEGRSVRGRREVRGGYEILETSLPAVLSVKTAANEPRFMDYRIKEWAFKSAPITVWSRADLEVDDAFIGQPGSPTWVSGLEQAPSSQRRRQFLEGTPDEIARQLSATLRQKR